MADTLKKVFIHFTTRRNRGAWQILVEHFGSAPPQKANVFMRAFPLMMIRRTAHYKSILLFGFFEVMLGQILIGFLYVYCIMAGERVQVGADQKGRGTDHTGLPGENRRAQRTAVHKHFRRPRLP